MFHDFPSTTGFDESPAIGISRAVLPGKPPLIPPLPRNTPAGHGAAKRQVTRTERMLAYGIAASLFIMALVVTPVAKTNLITLPGFLVSYATGLLILDLLVAMLLFCKARIEGNRSFVALGAAYLYAGLIIIPHVATFPGALVPGMIAGTDGSATWIWAFWHGGFAALIIWYALLTDFSPPPPRQIVTACCLVILLVAAAAYAAIGQTERLPAILQGNLYFFGMTGIVIRTILFGLNITATSLVVVKFRLQSAEGLWLTVGMIGACADVWLSLEGGHRYSTGWYGGRLCGVSTVFVLLMSLLHDVLRTSSLVAAANTVLDEMTFMDALTNLGNRRMFDETLQKEWRRCHRENMPLSVVMLDVDEFKAYNDTYGHQAGDACLQMIAGQLHASALRPGDKALRYGGEEFALILPATDLVGAGHVARSVRLRVRDLAIANPVSLHKVITVSAGVACTVPSDGADVNELIRFADFALYQAKAAGRDNVVIAA